MKWNRFTEAPIPRCHPREGGDRVTPAMLMSTESPLEFSPAKAGPGTTGSCDSMRTKCAPVASRCRPDKPVGSVQVAGVRGGATMDVSIEPLSEALGDTIIRKLAFSMNPRSLDSETTLPFPPVTAA